MSAEDEQRVWARTRTISSAMTRLASATRLLPDVAAPGIAELTVSDAMRGVRRGAAVVKSATTAILALATGWAMFNHGTVYGVAAFLVLGATLMPVLLWYRTRTAPTLPFAAVYGVMSAIWYGFPIVVGNEQLSAYSEDEVLFAAAEVALHMLTIVATGSIELRRPVPPKQIRMLNLSSSHEGPLTAMLLCGLAALTLWEYSMFSGSASALLNCLPPGSLNIVRTIATAGACGCCLLLAIRIADERRSAAATVFWLLWSAFFLIRAASLLLSSLVTVVAATALGLALGGRRVPWRFVLTATIVIAAMNRAKFDMRERYWAEFGGQPSNSLMEIYSSWTSVSVERLFNSWGSLGSDPGASSLDGTGQPLSHRLSNLQMLLLAQRGIHRGIPPLLGRTYTHGFVLLIPRVLWPEKPRSHASQIELNLHFGVQTEEQTFHTYIAWGILPEAYANFGPFVGSIASGILIGMFFAWIGRLSADRPVAALSSILSVMLLSLCVKWPGEVSSIIMTSTSQYALVLVAILYPLTSVRPFRPGSGYRPYA
jgi:hypothetical protein